MFAAVLVSCLCVGARALAELLSRHPVMRTVRVRRLKCRTRALLTHLFRWMGIGSRMRALRR